MKDKKYIGVVGTGCIGNASFALEIAKKSMESNTVALIVRSEKLPPDIFVNGVGYYRKQTPVLNSLGRISSLISMFSNITYSRDLPKGINIIDEFGKIELKKSKLKKWERDRVSSIFLNNFEKQE